MLVLKPAPKQAVTLLPASAEHDGKRAKLTD